MKRTVLLCLCFIVVVKAKPQVILNEIYSDPGAGKHEFFELYNTSGSTVPMSLDHYTIVTFFEITGKKGFYVMDLPNLNINPQGYFVGSSALPFNYQGITGSTASDFSWNSPALITNNGYLKKWVEGTANFFDGNLFYDEAPLPADFNDFFFRRLGVGHSYCVFVYKNGQLVNTFIGGTGGNSTVVTTIINMPNLRIDMVNPASTDFTINWTGYATIPLEYCIQDAGSDNGFIRERDGACGLWDKSSAGVQHTPQQTNGGQPDAYSGTISVSSTITRGTALTGSTVTYDVVGALLSEFPVEMMIYLDNGNISGQLDPADIYLESTIEYSLGEGPFTTTFYPYNSDILIVVKSAAGCIDKIQYLPNAGVLAVKLASFQGSLDNNRVMLNWTVMQNEAADRYVVERSLNGKDFYPVGIIEASNKIGEETYGLQDNVLEADKAFYRLKIYDKAQQPEYSKILSFQVSGANDWSGLRIINNPATDKLTISFMASTNQPADLNVYDLTGRKVMSQKITAYKGTNLVSIPLTYSLKNGMYVAEVNSNSRRFTAKFIKQ